MTDTQSKITILNCHGPGLKATKTFEKLENGDIQKKNYKCGRFFEHKSKSVSNIYELSDILIGIENDPRKCIIRGEAKDPTQQIVRRKIHEPDAAFDSIDRPYLMLDIDKLDCPDNIDPSINLEATITWIINALPDIFRDVTCHYQFSSSQNVQITKEDDKKGKTLSAHLWFYCNRSVSDKEWKSYFKSLGAKVDLSLFSPVQIHYTAKPIFINMTDPLIERSGIYKQKHDVVSVPDIPEEPERTSNFLPIREEPSIDHNNKQEAINQLGKHYVEGKRNNLTAALAATLFRYGWKEENIIDFIEELADRYNDDEISNRIQNAYNVCKAVQNKRPALGIPTLKDDLGIVNIFEILKLLGVQTGSVDDLINQLHSKSSIASIKNVLEKLTFSGASRSEYHVAFERIKKATKLSKGSLNRIADEVNQDAGANSANDYAFEVAKHYLIDQNNGHFFFRDKSKRYWQFMGICWKQVTDDHVKKEVIPIASSILALDEVVGGMPTTVNGALSLLAGLSFHEDNPLSDPKREIKPIVNFRNGELWLDDPDQPILKPHRADSYLTSYIDIAYDPDAKCPKFDCAIKEIFATSQEPDSMVRHFLEIMGYICQPTRDQAIILLLHGRGSNGKSALMKLINKILGHDLVMACSINSIENDKFRRGALENKQLLFEDDLKENTRLDDGFLKTVSEEKLLTGEQKYKDSYEFMCRVVPVMCSNNYPSISDLSDGLARRLKVIPFTRQFKESEKKPNLFNEIWEEEASGIINRLIDGFIRLQKRGHFKEPKECEASRNKWLVKSNILPSFIDDTCKTGIEHKQYLREFYSHFKCYCEDTGALPVPRQQWIRSRLENLGYEIRINQGEPMIYGLKSLYSEL